MPAIWHAPKQVRDPEIDFHYVDDEDPQENYSGETVGGRYKLIEPIGPGGTSTVYRAVDERTGSTVAVKILHSVLHERLLGYFGQEGRVAARHSNPHVIQAFDFGCEDGCAFTVFKFVDGVSLRTLARRGPMPWRRLCKIVLHVLSALRGLHQAGIVHNDLHPSNVMIQRDIESRDFAVVIDVGFATVLPTRKITNAPEPDNTVYGLRSYIAPERCAGCPPDPRSDLYALGVLMWEVLTAQTIPDFMSAPGIAVPTLASIAPGLEIPESVDRIVMRALSDIEYRFRDATDMAQAISDALAERVVAAPPPARRPQAAHALGVMLALGMMGGIAVGLILSSAPDEAVDASGSHAVYARPTPPVLEGRSRSAELASVSAPVALTVPAAPTVEPGAATLSTTSEVVAEPRRLTPKPAKATAVQRARRGIRDCDPEGKQVKSEVTIEARPGGEPQVRFNGRPAFGNLGDCVADVARRLVLPLGEPLRFKL